MTELNPDLDRLCRAAQQAANNGLDLRGIICAVLEEMKAPSARVQDAQLAAMAESNVELNTRDTLMATLGYFGILAAYRGTADDED